jgi:hypothetical protein
VALIRDVKTLMNAIYTKLSYSLNLSGEEAAI